MARRIVTVGDDFTLPSTTKVADANLPTRLGDAALTATILNQTAPVYSRLGDVPAELAAAGADYQFDPTLALYNWKPSNTKRFRAALGKAIAGTARCNIVCTGESTTAGQGVAVSDQSYPARMRDALLATGISSGGAGAAFPNRGGATLNDSALTLSAGWGRGGNSLVTDTTSAGATITFVGSGTTIEIISSNLGTGVFTYAIDGGAAVTITAGNANSLKTTTVTGLSDTSHTVVITTVGTARVYIYSIEARRAAGLIVTNAGASGAKTSDFEPNDFWRPGAVVVGRPRDLVLFGLGINDLAAATTAAALKASVIAIIQKFTPASDVVLTTSSPATGTWSAAAWSAYVQAFYEIADELNIPLIDVSWRFSYPDSVALGLQADNYHPNAAYYAERGRHHAKALTSG